MTAPLAPSTSTAPTDLAPGPVRDRAYWTAVIHNVAKIGPDDPRYSASRIVRDQAVQGLQDLADSASDAETKKIAPGKAGTAAVLFGHGASLGLAGDPQYIALARQEHPWTAFGGDVAGTAALARLVSPVVAGLSPVTQGIVLGGGLGAARGAIEPIPGMSRGESAAISGAGGAVTGALIGKFVSKLVPTVRTIAANIARIAGRAASPADVEAMTEAAVRAQLSKMKVRPDIIEQAVANWKANGTLSVRATPEPIAVRPGESVTPTPPPVSQEPILPKLRAQADPMETTPAYVRAGNPRGLPDIGGGKTLPYYPRGGVVEQSFGAPPATSPAVPGPVSAQGQLPIFAEYLKGATPADLASRLRTLRDMGVPLPQNAEAQLLALLFGAH